MNKLWISAMMIVSTSLAQAQVSGQVFEDISGKNEPLVGANVVWVNTTKGTVTDVEGRFSLERIPSESRLVISYVGYRSDTVNVNSRSVQSIVLLPDEALQEVVIEGNKSTAKINTLEGINSVTLTEGELCKAACCNLSESFETTASVDVSFTDAVTGTRQIQMLGLAGANTMIGVENMPGIRGLSSNVGMNFIPGAWVKSIQITKGTGSVVNGHESIAGQINVEMKKPFQSEKMLFNAYTNHSGRTELNFIHSQQVGKKWGTMTLFHGGARLFKHDRNNDGFLDFPLSNQINVVNRWVYKGSGRIKGQFGVKVLRDRKQGGQLAFNENTDRGKAEVYGLRINTNRYEAWGKVNYTDKNKSYKSVGLQMIASHHKQNAYFGIRKYDAKQNSLYANLMYQSIIGSPDHKLKAGFSFSYDQYDEQLNIGSFKRKEVVPGAYAEYTYDYIDKFTVVAGLRIDRNNLFGTFVTPRLHLRYGLGKNTTLRASVGRGQRTANVFAENISLLATSRQFRFANLQSSQGYGFRPVVAWNYGSNLIHDFKIAYRPATLSVDVYRTVFTNQVVVDVDTPTRVTFSGLKGEANSNSAQVQLNYELARRLDMRLAYRWIAVKNTYEAGLNVKPLVARNRGFLNLAYKTKNNWSFDLTTQWVGEQRFPNTTASPEIYRKPSYSPDYIIMNVHVNKSLKKNWDIYAGSENITNYKQKNAIISADNPFGAYFDSSMIYAPIFGRMVYVGVRWKLE